MRCFIIMIQERKNLDSYRLEFNDIAVNGYGFWRMISQQLHKGYLDAFPG